MKKIILCLYFLFSFVIMFSQTKRLELKSRHISEKEVTEFPDRIVEEQSNIIECEYNFPSVYINNVSEGGREYQYVMIDGFGLTSDVGKPALPTYSDIFAIPSKKGVEIRIVESLYEEYDNFLIHPALEPYADSYDVPLPVFKIDQATYSKNAYYPNDIVSIKSIEDYREIPLAFVEINPVQYNPVAKKIRCYYKLKYQILYNNGSENLVSKKVALNFEENSLKFLENITSNPNAIKQLHSMKNTTSNSVATLNAVNNISYIIITTNKYLPAAKEFAQWKTKIGFKTEVVSQASWTASQVKSAIHTRYAAWSPKPSYFLILGDMEDVPGETMANIYSHPTDLYYACMGGTGDIIADMGRGRIPVNSLEQAYMICRRIIEYECNPINNVEFYTKGLNCAEFQDDGRNGYEDRRFTQTSEEIRDYLTGKQGKIVNRVYAASSDIIPLYYNKSTFGYGNPIPLELRKDISPFFQWNGNAQNIINEINAGRFYVLHRDHGAVTLWGKPRFTVSDIDALRNGNKLPVVFSINCETGAYQSAQKCMAEHFLQNPNGGAIGVFAPTQISYSGYNDALAIGMVDAIWSKPGLSVRLGSGGNSNPSLNTHQDIYKMGDVLNQGLLRMRQTWGSATSSTQIYQFQIFHYFGDPAMEMYTDVPSAFSSAVVTERGAASAVINTGGVGGCRITLSSITDEGESYFKTVLLSAGTTSYTFTDITSPCHVTITKHNYKPYIYMQSAYVQNRIFNTNTTVEGRNINIGNNVDSYATQGPVKVNQRMQVTFKAKEEIYIKSGFEMELGAVVEFSTGN